MSSRTTLLKSLSTVKLSVSIKGGCSRGCIRYYGFLIGPPDPVSNIRPVKSEQPGSNEAEVRLVELRNNMHALNHTFWKEQNTKYEKEKQLFVAQELQRKGKSETSDAKLSAEELATFYERFLNENFNKQLEYFKKWHVMNIKYILLSVRANIAELLRHKK